MPQAIIGVIGAVTGTAVSTAVTVAVYAATLIGTLALSASQKRKAERQARAQYESSVVDRMVNVQNTVVARELVLGRVRKGGAIFFQSSVAPHNAVYIATLALAAHEIDGVERIYFNETPIDLDADGNVTTGPWGRWNKVSVSDTSAQPVRVLAQTPIPETVFVSLATSLPIRRPGQQSLPFTLVGNTLTIENYDPTQFYTVTYQWDQFVSTARVFTHLGSPDQASDARMQSLLPGTWTPAHRARGVAYLECEFVYEETSFPTGLPNITALVRGAKCYDPRSGLTAFTENPAIMARHVLLHPQFGKRTSLTADEDASIIAAANACDQIVSYTGADAVAKYRAALVTPFGAAARDVLDDLTQAMGGEWAYAGAEFVMRAGVYQAPVMHLTDADLAVVQRSGDGAVSQSAMGITPHRARNDKVNTVAIRIWDQAAGYLETPLAPYRADALVAADGAELSQEVVMPAVFYAGQANHIAGILLRDGRDPLSAVLPFKMRAYPLQLFDGVTLTLARYGWVNKEFRILDRRFSPEGFVVLTLKETTAAIYAQGAPFLPGGSTPNTGLPRPWDISPPTIIDIQSGEGELIVQNDGTVVNSVRVVWSPIQEASIRTGGSVEVQYQVLPDGAWRSVIVPGDATEARLTGVDDLASIVIRARSRNALATSDWSAQEVHQVIGKTEPPPEIEGFSVSGSVLSWSMPRRVPDLAGFVFRFHYGSNLDWNSATPLHTGLLTESPYDLVTRPSGIVTIMGKAQDTSGNQSNATANIVMNLGDAPVANILEQWDFRAMGWPIASDAGPMAPGRYPQYGAENLYSFARASTATYVDAAGQIQTAAVNAPRFEAGALLVEDVAINILNASELGIWTNNSPNAPAAGAILGLSGTRIYSASVPGDSPNMRSGAAQPAGVSLCGSYYFDAATKTGTGTTGTVRVLVIDVDGVQLVTQTFVVATGVAVGPPAKSGANATALAGGVEHVSGTVYRVWVSGTFAKAALSPLNIRLYTTIGNVGDTFVVGGPQIEVGTKPTSYIPTTGTPATRAADVAYVSEGQYGYARSSGDLVAKPLDSFYGTDNQSFYGADTEPFYEAGAYGEMVYVTREVAINSALTGSIMTLAAQAQGADLRIDYRLPGPGSFYGSDNDSFYRPDVVAFDPDVGGIVVTSSPFYGPPGAWQPWPGQLEVENDVYQFRVTIGAGATRGILEQLLLTVDAPDLEEEISDAVVPAPGLVIPYTKPFTSIKTVQVTLQANASGAVTTEVDKTNPLAPRVRAFNAAHVAVAGASVDITLKGY